MGLFIVHAKVFKGAHDAIILSRFWFQGFSRKDYEFANIPWKG